MAFLRVMTIASIPTRNRGGFEFSNKPRTIEVDAGSEAYRKILDDDHERGGGLIVNELERPEDERGGADMEIALGEATRRNAELERENAGLRAVNAHYLAALQEHNIEPGPVAGKPADRDEDAGADEEEGADFGGGSPDRVRSGRKGRKREG